MCSLLIQWRALHDALIIGFPVVVVAVIAWLIWKYWPRGRGPEMTVEPPMPKSSAPPMGIPPVVAAMVMLLALSLTNTNAANSETNNPQPAIVSASIVSANYSGTVNDRVALLDATLQFSSVTIGQTVPLFGDDVALQQFSVKNGRAELVRNEGGIGVRFNSKGGVTLQIKMLVKIDGDVTKRRLAFAIPPALSSQVSFALDEAGADVDFPAAISFQRILDQDKTRVEAVMGSTDHVELLLDAARKTRRRSRRHGVLPECRAGHVRRRRGERARDVGLSDHPGRIAAGVRGNCPPGRNYCGLKAKKSAPGKSKMKMAAQILVVDLLKGMSPSWRLTIETEKVLDALSVDAAVEIPHALGVKRESGLIALRGAEELALSVASASGLERVDAEEFGRTITDTTTNLASVFRFANPGFALRVRAEAIQPEIEGVVRNNFRVGAERFRSRQ